MPLYEYKCDGCGEVFEVMQKFSDNELTVHEKCGGAVHRLLSAPAFQFKGSGWYVTDYAKSGGSSPKGEPAPKSESTSSETKAADTKPAASTEKSKAD